MNEAQSIMSIIRGATMSEDGSVIEAKVIGAGPLKVQATNDDKLILNAGSLVVPWHLTDYTTKMTRERWTARPTTMGRTAVMWAATVHTLTTCERSTCIKAPLPFTTRSRLAI